MNTSSVVDLSADLPEDTYDLHITRPGTATPNGWVITLAGPSHPKAVAYKNEFARERIHKEAKIEAAQINNRKHKPEEKTVEETEIANIKWIVSRIVTWTPIKIGAETIEFSDDAAIRLLIQPKMAHYIQQIVDYLNGERAFIPTSASN